MGWRSAVTTTSSPWSRRHETLNVVPCHSGAFGVWKERRRGVGVSQALQAVSPGSHWTNPAKTQKPCYTHIHTYLYPLIHLCDVDAGPFPRGLLPLHDEVVHVLPEGRAWKYADG